MQRTGAALLLILLAVAAGCGQSGSPSTTAAIDPAQTNFEVMRDKVVLGFAKEFRAGTHAGPSRYGLCVRLGLRRALTRDQLNRLVMVYRRPGGQQFAAQALVRLAAPVGAECGGARYLPEMVAASEALGGRYPLSRLAVAARRLGIVYGPFLGLTCRRAASRRCGEVGVDVVLQRDARAVTVWVGGRRLSLLTPGLHSGVAGKDWVGYLRRVGLARPGSPFQLPLRGRTIESWAGYPPVYLPVRLEIVYPDDSVVRGALPRVFLSPGWG